MSPDSERSFSALNEIRDRALLLSLGKDYLCKASILETFGLDVDASAKQLESNILSLRKRFPGKFTHEIDTDGILKKIHHIANRLQKPDKGVMNECTVGTLGQELEEQVHSLTHAINDIRNLVDGKPLKDNRKASISKLAEGTLDFGSRLGQGFISLLKILFCLLLVSGVAFVYLFLTMEREDTFLKQVARSEALIQSQQKVLMQLNDEHRTISKKIAHLRGKKHSRQDTIEILELSIRAHNIDLERQKVEAEMNIHAQKIQDNRKKIEEIKKKSFVRRLLRQ